MKIDSSLKAKNGRLKGPYQLGQKNYNISAYRAKWSVISGGLVEPLEIPDTTDLIIHGFTFTQDFPIWWKLGTRWSIAEEPTFSHYVDRLHTFTVDGGVPSAIFTPNADNLSVDPYQQRQGETLTNGLEVSGYYGKITPPDEALLEDGIAVSELIAASPQIFGPMYYGYGVSDTERVYHAIYLPETEYTQAIKSNNNQLSVINDGVTYVYSVVGLYTLEIDAPQM